MLAPTAASAVQINVIRVTLASSILTSMFQEKSDASAALLDALHVSWESKKPQSVYLAKKAGTIMMSITDASNVTPSVILAKGLQETVHLASPLCC